MANHQRYGWYRLWPLLGAVGCLPAGLLFLTLAFASGGWENWIPGLLLFILGLLGLGRLVLGQRIPPGRILRRKGDPGQPFRVPNMEFLGEQDGSVERELQGKWTALLQAEPPPCLAYLARVKYPHESEPSVILCIYTQRADPKPLLRDLLNIFQKMFNRNEHLDLLCLTPQTRADLERVCPPFFDNTGT